MKNVVKYQNINQNYEHKRWHGIGDLSSFTEHKKIESIQLNRGVMLLSKFE